MSARMWWIRCPTCSGEGITSECLDVDDERIWECEDCSGEGVVEAPEATPDEVADGIEAMSVRHLMSMDARMKVLHELLRMPAGRRAYSERVHRHVEAVDPEVA